MGESRKQFLEWWRHPEQEELRKSCAEGSGLQTAISGGASGAMSGAALGSIVPGLGTGLGAAIGGGLGLLGSLF